MLDVTSFMKEMTIAMHVSALYVSKWLLCVPERVSHE